MIESTMKPNGGLAAKKIPARRAPLSWRIRNLLRASFLSSLIGVFVIVPLARMFGILTGYAKLSARVRKASGEWIDYGVLSYRVITNNGVAYIVDAWQNSVEMEAMKYHGCGTTNTAENVVDSALAAESTTVLNPDSTRATGSTTESAANAFQTVGTLTFDGSAAVVEHGLFNQAATGGGTMFDRSVFSTINVGSGDSIQFTYTCTLTAGG
jgi:hypothetical protein